MMHAGWICVVLGMVSGSLLGNVGGYYRGGVAHAGDVRGFEPESTEKIRILDEKLNVTLGTQEADVEIRYLMHNETAKKVTVRFGFPVEETFDDKNYDPGMPTQTSTETWKEPRYCRDYQISAGGKALKVKWQAEDRMPENNNPAARPFRGIVGWMVSELTFTGGEEIPVLIRFRSTYPDSLYGSSGDSSTSGSFFNYRLSTAACWAGTIGSGRITLKPAGIDPRRMRVIKPVNRFRKEGDSWIWNFENLEPTLADDLVVEAVPVVNYRWGGEHHDYLESNGEWSMITTNYKAKASSTLPPEKVITYDVSNLNDGIVDNVWAEGKPGPGIGEWLELRPEVPKQLRAILMSPGYQKSRELFLDNARPKKVKVMLNGEHVFTVDVPDKKADCVIPVKGYTKPVSVIKIVFEEVWPGAKFEDLCVSDVRLEVKLDKKPKLPQIR